MNHVEYSNMKIDGNERAIGLELIARDGNLWPEAVEELQEAAKLLRTIPPMVEALRECRRQLEVAIATIERLKPPRPYDSTQGTRDVINAAIAKAKGGE